MATKSNAVRLTKRVVDQAPPLEKRTFLWDAELKGFGVQIEPTGTKSYVLRYRPKGLGRDGEKRFTRLGRHGELTTDQARDLAKSILGRVAAGEDPALERQAGRSEHVKARDAITVKELGELFLKEHVQAKRKAGTEVDYRAIFQLHVFPALGELKAHDLKRADLAKLHLNMKDLAPTANRMLSVISSMFSFASRRELVPDGTNPSKGIERYRQHGRERYLSLDEIKRLGEALIEGETEGIPWKIDPTKPTSKHTPKNWKGQRDKLDPYAAAAIRLLLFTGARLREVLDLKWGYVDLDRGLLHLPDSKTGRKIIVLSSAALTIIKGISELPDSKTGPTEYVIRGKLPGKPRSDLKKPWEAVRNYADLQDVRLHDLRHTFASIGAGSSLGLPIVGKLLGHSQPQTTARYAHLDADPLRRATDMIGEHILRAMAPSPAQAKET